MEITCKRCHRTLEAEDCYCPTCGLPQLVYTADTLPEESQPEHWDKAVPDASTIQWKPALRVAILLAVPAGLLSSEISPVGFFGLFWMAAAAAWAVTLYMRSQRPAWITLGAGARIGLVTGLLASWVAFGVSGGALFVQRFLLHRSSQIDAQWKTQVGLNQQIAQQLTSGMNMTDAAQMKAAQAQVQALMLSPWGHAGFVVFGLVVNAAFLLIFAVAGGALGARLLVRKRRPEV
jgi:hypothetical protein